MAQATAPIQIDQVIARQRQAPITEPAATLAAPTRAPRRRPAPAGTIGAPAAPLAMPARPPAPIPINRSVTVELPPAPPAVVRPRPRLHPILPRLARAGGTIGRAWGAHLLVLALVLGITLTGQSWQERTIIVPPSPGADTFAGNDYLLLPSAPAPAPTPPSATANAFRVNVAQPIMGDYLTQPALPITNVPQRLTIHEVRPGDTLASIAERFSIDVPTLQWANGIAEPSTTLTPGQQLRVPAIKGMLHVVRQSDTLTSIAATYKVTPEAITNYRPNQIRDVADLVPGRTIMVPGGTMPTRTNVIVHTVQEGETVFVIAERYNVTTMTIISANSLPDPDFLQVGQQLAILPVAGTGLIVKPGETVAGLAERYGVDEAAIRNYAPNGLGGGGEVVVGQALVIPGGRLPEDMQPWLRPEPEPEPEPEPVQAPAPVTSAARTTSPAPAPRPTPRPEPAPAPRAATGRMAWPTSGSITTYFSGSHNGLDIANAFGTAISAADGGVVTYAGWRNDGLGIAVFIDHGNGLQTWYGHFSSVAVEPGQRVSKGQYLGAMGSTGRSTGPHLHFMVLVNYGYRNPLSYLP